MVKVLRGRANSTILLDEPSKLSYHDQLPRALEPRRLFSSSKRTFRANSTAMSHATAELDYAKAYAGAGNLHACDGWILLCASHKRVQPCPGRRIRAQCHDLPCQLAHLGFSVVKTYRKSAAGPAATCKRIPDTNERDDRKSLSDSKTQRHMLFPQFGLQFDRHGSCRRSKSRPLLLAPISDNDPNGTRETSFVRGRNEKRSCGEAIGNRVRGELPASSPCDFHT